jgi:hypothetical protein
MNRSSERGVAMIVALFMVLVLSVLGSSLMFVSRTETLSSLNYKTMSQARYGAESGVHRAANHLLWTYVPPGTLNVLDPLAAVYDTTQSPVQFAGADVVLSSDPDVASNYPVAAVRDAFAAAAQGALDTGNGSVEYAARAVLLAMREIPHPFIPGSWITLQTWQITGTGNIAGAGSAEVEVSAVVEKQAVPVFKYAAFATYPGCGALRFGGGATTDSYDSSDFLGVGTPTLDDYGGNVGTNGSLTEIGSSTAIHGSLSTPRTGVGPCGGGGAVSALTVSGGATLDDGLVQLPQAVPYPTPPPPSPLPPTTSDAFTGGCALSTLAFCAGGGGSALIDPSLTGGTVTMGNVSVTAGTNLVLKAGIYVVNSISLVGGASITLDIDPTAVPAQSVIFHVAGEGSVTRPIDFLGGSISNDTYDPSRFQFLYGGDKNIRLTGGSESAALIYAPNASGSFSGGGDFYGAVVTNKITDMGGASIHYDRNLDTEALMEGNPTLSAFTWRSF